METAKELSKRLIRKTENGGLLLNDAQIKEVETFNEGYKTFLDYGKTEREVVSYSIELAQKQGYTAFDPKKKYVAGDKVYYNNRGKALILAVIGTDPIENGVSIMAAHIDSPRLDLKPNPLYEEAQISLLKTHYYGGIKKYQWTAIPLSLHGVIMKKDGTKVTVCIGEDDCDPVFCITDLLPHLAAEQSKRTLNDGVRGEELNVLIGSYPFRDDEISEKVKLNVMQILNEKYGIIEQDFLCAELEMVPAFKAKDVGIDRSLVGAYGQDDRVCAYTALIATFDVKAPKTTVITVLADKEEIGSEGNSGLQCAFLRYFVADLGKPYGIDAREILSNSKCLSADVSVAFDPTWADVSEKNNTSYINYGVVITKYTGSRGKGGSSDASAEFMGYVRSILEADDVIWQAGELGKVDCGGGGTVAAYIANLNVDVVDMGVPVLSMHAPWEITAKIDVYMAYKAFYAFAKR